MMPISIKEIVVENLGPLGDGTFELGKLNLIFGRNETGKTYLVEFLIRSLFRHASAWPMRGELGRGKVTVSGLDGGETDFTPDSRKKLEDYWDQAGSGLPTNMARLMVVKGAELALTDAEEVGIDRAVLKAAVSSEALMDQILSGITATVQQAEVVDGRIEAAQRGEIKTRSELEENIERLADLREQVEGRYSGGRLRALELAREEMLTELAQQQDARHHQAYLMHQSREQRKKKLGDLPKQELEELERAIGRHQDKQDELSRSLEELDESKKEVEHYPWLKQAAELWEARALEDVGRRSAAAAVLAVVFSAGGLLAALSAAIFDLIPAATIGLAITSLIAFALGTVFWIIYARRLRQLASGAVNIEQRREIEAEYKRRFGRLPSGLAGLKAHEGALRDKQIKFEHLSESIEADKVELSQLENTIERLLQVLGAENVPPESWNQVTKRTRDWENSLTDEIHELDVRLGKLDVDESDFRQESVDTEFSAEKLRELQEDLEQLTLELNSAQQDLDGLKQEVTRETGDEITAPWEQVLDHLWQRHLEAEQDYRRTTARILGQIGVTQVLEQIRIEEDEKIRAGLQAPDVTQLLQDITGAYNSLDFEDSRILVQGDIATYDLADLSTGAREQVLLAIRMGFASRLAGGQPLFLLLDDAFQHSDWDRRKRLVDHVITLVQAGWQVTYLTMDDHLSDLFREAGEQALGDDYRHHVIES